MPRIAMLVCAALSAACASGPVAMNKDIVRRMMAAIDARDFDALDELVDRDVRRHSAATPGVVVENLDQFKDFLRHDQVAVPDSKQEIRHVTGEGDFVAVHAIYRGTQRGQMGPFPPTGRTLEVPFLALLRVEAGKIAEMWVEWDNMAALTQLGHVVGPPPAGGGMKNAPPARRPAGRLP